MPAQVLAQSNDQSSLHALTTSVTGSAQFRTRNKRTVIAVHASVQSSLAAEANKAVSFTWSPDANDPSQFTLYAWKHTSNADPTLIAATAAVDVCVSALSK